MNIKLKSITCYTKKWILNQDQALIDKKEEDLFLFFFILGAIISKHSFKFKGRFYVMKLIHLHSQVDSVLVNCKNIKSKYFLFFTLSIISVSLSSCIKHDDISDYNDHTVIVYMLANNDLYSSALKNIDDMEYVWESNYNGKLMVLIESQSQDKGVYLMEISKDNRVNLINSKIVHIYEDKNAINPNDMNDIITDIVDRYPSKKYTLILWSHATGWLPPHVTLNKAINSSSILVKNKSFGDSSGSQMKLEDLTIAIPSNLFEIIIFDACYMGSIEVLYEIKDKAKYFIASPTEIMAQGFPYKSMIPILFSGIVDAKKIAKCFIDYYESLEGEYQSATIGVVKATELDNFAKSTKALILHSNSPFQDIIDNIHEIQIYDRYNNNIFFDLKQTLSLINYNEEYNSTEMDDQFHNTIIYGAGTKKFLNHFDIKYCSGISCYIPYKRNVYLNHYYSNLKWYIDSGFNIVFDHFIK